MQVIVPQAAVNNSYFSLPAGTSSEYLFNEDPSSSSPTMQPNLNDSVQIQQLLALLNNNMLPKQTAVVDCPKSMVGRVIGKGGETIKALQQYTGAMIQIDQSTDPTRVTIAGSPQALQLAVSMVSDIVRGTFKGFAMLRQIAVQHGNLPSSSSSSNSNSNSNTNVALASLPSTFTPAMQQHQHMPAMMPPQTMQQQMYHQQPTPMAVAPPPVVHVAPPPLTPAEPSPTGTTGTSSGTHPVYIQGYGFIPPSQATLGGEGGGFDDIAAAMLQQQQQPQQQQRQASTPPMNLYRAAPPPGNNNGGGVITAESLAALLGTLGTQSQNNNNNHNHHVQMQQQQPGSDMNEALLTALLSQLTVGQQPQAAAYHQQYAPQQQQQQQPQYQQQQQDAAILFHGGNEQSYGLPPPSSFLSSSPPSNPASSLSPPSNSGRASPLMFPSAAHQQMGLSSTGDLPLLSSPPRQPAAAGGGGSRYGAIGSARSPTRGSSLNREHQETKTTTTTTANNIKVLAEPQQINVVTIAATEVFEDEDSKKQLLVPTTWAEAVSNGSTTTASPEGLATSPSSSN